MNTTRILTLAAVLFSSSALSYAQNDAPPVASTGGNVGDDYVVDCNNVFAPGSAVTSVQLDGSGSFDPNGTPITFQWFEECPFGVFPDPTSATPIYQIDMTGVCFRSCVVELRVTSGGQTTKKVFRVTVQDSTPPVVMLPGDVLGIYGDPTAPGFTGSATAVDNCDPAPFISFSEVIIPQGGPGTPEQIIQRTWTATDCTGLQSTGMQTITLLSPSGGSGAFANLDFDPSNCPNMYSPLQTGTVDVVLLGSTSFPVKDVVKSSLRIWVRNHPGVSVAPTSVLTKDLGSITAAAYGDCNSLSLDGKKDLRLRFSRALLASQLGLSSYTSGQSLDIAVTGLMKSGKVFATRDHLTIQ